MGEITNPGIQQAADEFDLTQFYQIFFEEAGENLANYETLLLNIDIEDASDEDLNAIFRAAHSIKGGAATFGFSDVAELTHELETLLDRARKRELQLTTEMVDCLLASGDALKEQLARHQAGGEGEPIVTTSLISNLRRLSSGESAPASAPAATQAASATKAVKPGERVLKVLVGPLPDPKFADNLVDLFSEIPGIGTMRATDEGKADSAGLRQYEVITTSADNDLLDLFTFYVDREKVVISDAAPPAAVAAPAIEMSEADKAKQEAEQGYGFFVDPATLPSANAAATPVAASAPASNVSTEPKAAKPAKEKAAAAAAPETTLRVSVEKVDQLINLVGELVITQAMLAQKGKTLDPVKDQAIISGLSDLERNTRDLQEAVMSIRMIPMSFVFNRFPRMLRDLAAKLGKQVELKTTGEATELDKGLIEKITDPLTHLVRNSVDHGIEKPEDRIAKGKSAHGTITLSAQHQGSSIVIEVRDDGRGLNRDKILAKARSSGIPVSDNMPDSEVWQLIFAPGFSTAEVVTDVSGRGVGMDVVKRNILSLGGTVELDSAEGYGTRVSVRLPLTLAIMDGMSVGVGEEVYILPLASVVETFQADESRIKTLAGLGRVVQVREEYLPVRPLDEMFDVPRFEWGSNSSIMVIVEAEDKRVALVVDELIGQHQVVVKNLEANYRKVNGVSGATILGDGRVALILDVAQFTRSTR
jgi:two-component system, chemotaxis family, sensor kinase CheA